MFIEIARNIVALNNIAAVTNEVTKYKVHLKDGVSFEIYNSDYLYLREALKGLNQLVYAGEEEIEE